MARGTHTVITIYEITGEVELICTIRYIILGNDSCRVAEFWITYETTPKVQV